MTGDLTAWNFLPTIAFVLLIAAAVIQIVFLFRRREEPDPASAYFLAFACLLLFTDLLIRSIVMRFPAVTGLFESLVLFSACIALLVILYRLRFGKNSLPFVIFGGTITAILLLAVASSPVAPADMAPPVPALQSHWLALHVAFAFVGEAFFAVAFVTSILYLVVKDPAKKDHLDRLTYVTIAAGYPVFTAGALVFGAIWAETAWGAWWSWDPKETWALVTWLVYTGYLHQRLIRGKKGRTAAIFSIAGFVLTLFTLFGVNFLLAGLHSYR